MKASTKPGTPKRKAAPASKASGQIHPIILYPFRNPADYTHLEELYRLASRLDADRETYARPVTVMDRKTYFSVEDDAAFQRFRKDVVAKHSDLLDAWCVDTCQMWYSGLGAAHERGGAEDVYWLSPGDFNGWNPTSHPMKQGPDKVWFVQMELKPGHHPQRPERAGVVGPGERSVGRLRARQ